MATIIVTEFVSLDGVIEDPGGSEGFRYGGWTFEFPGEDRYGVQGRGDLRVRRRCCSAGRRTRASRPRGRRARASSPTSSTRCPRSSSRRRWRSRVAEHDRRPRPRRRARAEGDAGRDIRRARQRAARPFAARRRPGRPAQPDGVPSRARPGQAAVRRDGRQAESSSSRDAHGRRQRRDPGLPSA